MENRTSLKIMICVRIIEKDKQVGAIIYSHYDYADKYALLTVLKKTIEFCKYRFPKRNFYFYCLDKCDGKDYAFYNSLFVTNYY